MQFKHSQSSGIGSPDVWGIYEPATGSIQYVCADPETRKAALVDVVLDFDPASARTNTQSADAVFELVRRENLEVIWILDTHPHADHFMAAGYLKEKSGAPTAIGEKVADIAELWRDYYNMPAAFDVSRDFDRLLAEGDILQIGNLDVQVWLSPGHTLGSVTYKVGDAAFVHDTLMYPDTGTSRTDFPGGSTEQLWDSIQRILSLPEETRLFVGHDYCADGRDEPAWEANVADHKAHNIHVKDGTSREEFVARRGKRDATLGLPDRMLAALQVNLRGGRLPGSEPDGNSYLKIPLTRF